MHLRPSITDIMQSTQPTSSQQFPLRRRTDSRVGLEPDAIPDEVNDIIRRTIKSNQTLSFSTDQLTTSNCLLTLQAAINKTFTSDAINDKTSFINNTTLFPFEKPVSENTDHDIKNTKSAKQFISAFLDFYLIVRNYEANSHLFTIKDICESIILRLLTFSWMMVDLQKSAVEMSEPTSDTSSLAGYLEDTLKLLRIFSRGDPSCRIIGQHNGISLIHHIMNLNPSFTRIQVECCATLANLSINSDNRASMLQVGCLKLVVDNMRRFDNIPEIQTEICAALTNISCYERNATFILQAGGWQLIVRALETYKTHVDLQVQGFHALSSLSKHAKPSSLASMTHLNLATTSRAMSGTNTSIASTDMNDVLKCIFTAMKLHKLEAEVVIATCNTLGSLSLSAQSSIRLQEMEIVTMIFEGMKRFRLNDNYQVSACFALAHLFFSSALPLHLATPGIELILKAMKQFPFHESLQTTASFLLGTVTSLEKNRHELFKHDGVPLILAAMGRVYPNEERRRGAIRIVPSQAIANDPVVEAEQHQQNRSTNTRAENGDTNETTDRSRSDNGRSMRTKQISKHFLLQMFGCVALLNLSSEDDGRRQKIIEMGAIHYVYQASQKVKCQEDLYFVINYIFTKLSKCQESRSFYMASSGAPSLVDLCRKRIIESIVDCPNNHSDNASPQTADPFRSSTDINLSETHYDGIRSLRSFGSAVFKTQEDFDTASEGEWEEEEEEDDNENVAEIMDQNMLPSVPPCFTFSPQSATSTSCSTSTSTIATTTLPSSFNFSPSPNVSSHPQTSSSSQLSARHETISLYVRYKEHQEFANQMRRQIWEDVSKNIRFGDQLPLTMSELFCCNESQIFEPRADQKSESIPETNANSEFSVDSTLSISADSSSHSAFNNKYLTRYQPSIQFCFHCRCLVHGNAIRMYVLEHQQPNINSSSYSTQAASSQPSTLATADTTGRVESPTTPLSQRPAIPEKQVTSGIIFYCSLQCAKECLRSRTVGTAAISKGKTKKPNAGTNLDVYRSTRRNKGRIRKSSIRKRIIDELNENEEGDADVGVNNGTSSPSKSNIDGRTKGRAADERKKEENEDVPVNIVWVKASEGVDLKV